MKRFLILVFAVYFAVLSQARGAEVQSGGEMEEGRAIAECLEPYGGVTPENAERLQRYKQWSATYEEIPCFTSCYLGKMFDIYNESAGFNQENVIKQFGATLFAACKERLSREGAGDACKLAYNGFHCLVSLENDPFVYIEGLQKFDMETKTAMKECLHRFDQYEWERLPDYSNFPVREPIPCFTKCFVDHLELYNERTKLWNTESVRSKLGVSSEGTKLQRCRALGQRRSRNVCAWMYQQITCLLLAK